MLHSIPLMWTQDAIGVWHLMWWQCESCKTVLPVGWQVEAHERNFPGHHAFHALPTGMTPEEEKSVVDSYFDWIKNERDRLVASKVENYRLARAAEDGLKELEDRCPHRWRTTGFTGKYCTVCGKGV